LNFGVIQGDHSPQQGQKPMPGQQSQQPGQGLVELRVHRSSAVLPCSGSTGVFSKLQRDLLTGRLRLVWRQTGEALIRPAGKMNDRTLSAPRTVAGRLLND
jgi:hypothetical protein